MISFDLGRFVVFGFMGLGFLVGWWVYKRGLVVESGGAIGLLVGLECQVWVWKYLIRLCQRERVRSIFVLFKNSCHVYESLLATCQFF